MITIEMPLDSAANTITCVKRRMHDIQDYHEQHPELPKQYEVMLCYKEALDALNKAVPAEFRQEWVRSELTCLS
jgi:hypothetical protein